MTDDAEAMTIALRRVIDDKRVSDGIRALDGRGAIDVSRRDARLPAPPPAA